MEIKINKLLGEIDDNEKTVTSELIIESSTNMVSRTVYDSITDIDIMTDVDTYYTSADDDYLSNCERDGDDSDCSDTNQSFLEYDEIPGEVSGVRKYDGQERNFLIDEDVNSVKSYNSILSLSTASFGSLVDVSDITVEQVLINSDSSVMEEKVKNVPESTRNNSKSVQLAEIDELQIKSFSNIACDDMYTNFESEEIIETAKIVTTEDFITKQRFQESTPVTSDIDITVEKECQNTDLSLMEILGKREDNDETLSSELVIESSDSSSTNNVSRTDNDSFTDIDRITDVDTYYTSADDDYLSNCERDGDDSDFSDTDQSFLEFDEIPEEVGGVRKYVGEDRNFLIDEDVNSVRSNESILSLSTASFRSFVDLSDITVEQVLINSDSSVMEANVRNVPDTIRNISEIVKSAKQVEPQINCFGNIDDGIACDDMYPNFETEEGVETARRVTTEDCITKQPFQDNDFPCYIDLDLNSSISDGSVLSISTESYESTPVPSDIDITVEQELQSTDLSLMKNQMNKLPSEIDDNDKTVTSELMIESSDSSSTIMVSRTVYDSITDIDIMTDVDTYYTSADDDYLSNCDSDDSDCSDTNQSFLDLIEIQGEVVGVRNSVGEELNFLNDEDVNSVRSNESILSLSRASFSSLVDVSDITVEQVLINSDSSVTVAKVRIVPETIRNISKSGESAEQVEPQISYIDSDLNSSISDGSVLSISTASYESTPVTSDIDITVEQELQKTNLSLIEIKMNELLGEIENNEETLTSEVIIESSDSSSTNMVCRTVTESVTDIDILTDVDTYYTSADDDYLSNCERDCDDSDCSDTNQSFLEFDEIPGKVVGVRKPVGEELNFIFDEDVNSVRSNKSILSLSTASFGSLVDVSDITVEQVLINSDSSVMVAKVRIVPETIRNISKSGESAEQVEPQISSSGNIVDNISCDNMYPNFESEKIVETAKIVTREDFITKQLFQDNDFPCYIDSDLNSSISDGSVLSISTASYESTPVTSDIDITVEQELQKTNLSLIEIKMNELLGEIENNEETLTSEGIIESSDSSSTNMVCRTVTESVTDIDILTDVDTYYTSADDDYLSNCERDCDDSDCFDTNQSFLEFDEIPGKVVEVRKPVGEELNFLFDEDVNSVRSNESILSLSTASFGSLVDVSDITVEQVLINSDSSVMVAKVRIVPGTIRNISKSGESAEQVEPQISSSGNIVDNISCDNMYPNFESEKIVQPAKIVTREDFITKQLFQDNDFPCYIDSDLNSSISDGSVLSISTASYESTPVTSDIDITVEQELQKTNLSLIEIQMNELLGEIENNEETLTSEVIIESSDSSSTNMVCRTVTESVTDIDILTDVDTYYTSADDDYLSNCERDCDDSDCSDTNQSFLEFDEIPGKVVGVRKPVGEELNFLFDEDVNSVRSNESILSLSTASFGSLVDVSDITVEQVLINSDSSVMVAKVRIVPETIRNISKSGESAEQVEPQISSSGNIVDNISCDNMYPNFESEKIVETAKIVTREDFITKQLFQDNDFPCYIDSDLNSSISDGSVLSISTASYESTPVTSDIDITVEQELQKTNLSLIEIQMNELLGEIENNEETLTSEVIIESSDSSSTNMVCRTVTESVTDIDILTDVDTYYTSADDDYLSNCERDCDDSDCSDTNQSFLEFDEIPGKVVGVRKPVGEELNFLFDEDVNSVRSNESILSLSTASFGSLVDVSDITVEQVLINSDSSVMVAKVRIVPETIRNISKSGESAEQVEPQISSSGNIVDNISCDNMYPNFESEKIVETAKIVTREDFITKQLFQDNDFPCYIDSDLNSSISDGSVLSISTASYESTPVTSDIDITVEQELQKTNLSLIEIQMNELLGEIENNEETLTSEVIIESSDSSSTNMVCRTVTESVTDIDILTDVDTYYTSADDDYLSNCERDCDDSDCSDTNQSFLEFDEIPGKVVGVRKPVGEELNFLFDEDVNSVRSNESILSLSTASFGSLVDVSDITVEQVLINSDSSVMVAKVRIVPETIRNISKSGESAEQVEPQISSSGNIVDNISCDNMYPNFESEKIVETAKIVTREDFITKQLFQDNDFPCYIDSDLNNSISDGSVLSISTASYESTPVTSDIDITVEQELQKTNLSLIEIKMNELLGEIENNEETLTSEVIIESSDSSSTNMVCRTVTESVTDIDILTDVDTYYTSADDDYLSNCERDCDDSDCSDTNQSFLEFDEIPGKVVEVRKPVGEELNFLFDEDVNSVRSEESILSLSTSSFGSLVDVSDITVEQVLINSDSSVMENKVENIPDPFINITKSVKLAEQDDLQIKDFGNIDDSIACDDIMACDDMYPNFETEEVVEIAKRVATENFITTQPFQDNDFSCYIDSDLNSSISDGSVLSISTASYESTPVTSDINVSVEQERLNTDLSLMEIKMNKFLVEREDNEEILTSEVVIKSSDSSSTNMVSRTVNNSFTDIDITTDVDTYYTSADADYLSNCERDGKDSDCSDTDQLFLELNEIQGEVVGVRKYVEEELNFLIDEDVNSVRSNESILSLSTASFGSLVDLSDLEISVEQFMIDSDSSAMIAKIEIIHGNNNIKSKRVHSKEEDEPDAVDLCDVNLSVAGDDIHLNFKTEQNASEQNVGTFASGTKENSILKQSIQNSDVTCYIDEDLNSSISDGSVLSISTESYESTPVASYFDVTVEQAGATTIPLNIDTKSQRSDVVYETLDSSEYNIFRQTVSDSITDIPSVRVEFNLLIDEDVNSVRSYGSIMSLSTESFGSLVDVSDADIFVEQLSQSPDSSVMEMKVKDILGKNNNIPESYDSAKKDEMKFLDLEEVDCNISDSDVKLAFRTEENTVDLEKFKEDFGAAEYFTIHHSVRNDEDSFCIGDDVSNTRSDGSILSLSTASCNSVLAISDVDINVEQAILTTDVLNIDAKSLLSEEVHDTLDSNIDYIFRQPVSDGITDIHLVGGEHYLCIDGDVNSVKSNSSILFMSTASFGSSMDLSDIRISVEQVNMISDSSVMEKKVTIQDEDVSFCINEEMNSSLLDGSINPASSCKRILAISDIDVAPATMDPPLLESKAHKLHNEMDIDSKASSSGVIRETLNSSFDDIDRHTVSDSIVDIGLMNEFDNDNTSRDDVYSNTTPFVELEDILEEVSLPSTNSNTSITSLSTTDYYSSLQSIEVEERVDHPSATDFMKIKLEKLRNDCIDDEGCPFIESIDVINLRRRHTSMSTERRILSENLVYDQNPGKLCQEVVLNLSQLVSQTAESSYTSSSSFEEFVVHDQGEGQTDKSGVNCIPKTYRNFQEDSNTTINADNCLKENSSITAKCYNLPCNSTLLVDPSNPEEEDKSIDDCEVDGVEGTSLNIKSSHDGSALSEFVISLGVSHDNEEAHVVLESNDSTLELRDICNVEEFEVSEELVETTSDFDMLLYADQFCDETSSESCVDLALMSQSTNNLCFLSTSAFSDSEPYQQVSSAAVNSSSSQKSDRKRSKKYRKKIQSSQKCQSSSTSHDEFSDVKFVRRKPGRQLPVSVQKSVEYETTEIANLNIESPDGRFKSTLLPESDPNNSPIKDIIELNLTMEQDNAKQTCCIDSTLDFLVSAAVDDEPAESNQNTHFPPVVDEPAESCSSNLNQTTCIQDSNIMNLSPETELNEYEFISVLRGLKPTLSVHIQKAKLSMTPTKKRPSRKHIRSWAKHLVPASSKPVEIIATHKAASTPVEFLIKSTLPAFGGGLFSRSSMISDPTSSIYHEASDRSIEDNNSLSPLDYQNTVSMAAKVDDTTLSCPLFRDKNDDIEKFEENIYREDFNNVMQELMFAVQILGENSGSDSEDPKTSDCRTIAYPTNQNPSTSGFLDLSMCESTGDEVERLDAVIQQQYFSRITKEIKSWSYDPSCELDDDELSQVGVFSEPSSSSEGDPPINSFLSRKLQSVRWGSDSEVCTPIKLPGLDPHSCPDSPYQKAHSLSVVLKSPDIRKFQSKLKPCRNPNCGACQARRKQRSHRWKTWKVLSQDGNPCETN